MKALAEILPNGWSYKRIDELGHLHSGATPSTDVAEYWGDDIVWVTPNDLSMIKTRRISDSGRRITEAGLRSCSTRLLPKGSLIISSRAPIGYLAIAQTEFCTNQGCKTLVFSPDQDPDFHYYNLSYRVKMIKEKGGGTTFAEVSKTALANIEFPVPDDKAEQIAIAEILITVDEAIEQTEALIAKQRRIWAGLLHDLLTRGIDENGQLRDPATHRFKPSPVGLVPEEWELRVLSNVVDPNRPIVYGILMPGYGFPNGVPVVKVKDIVDNSINMTDLLLTDPKIDEAYKRSRLQRGDLLFSIRGTVGRMAFVPAALDAANITQDTARISITRASPLFVRHYLDMHIARTFIDLHTLGQAVKGINLERVREIPVPLPSPHEQERIIPFLVSIDDNIWSHNVHLAKLRRLKTGLMQDLFSGRISVPRLDKFHLG